MFDRGAGARAHHRQIETADLGPLDREFVEHAILRLDGRAAFVGCRARIVTEARHQCGKCRDACFVVRSAADLRLQRFAHRLAHAFEFVAQVVFRPVLQRLQQQFGDPGILPGKLFVAFRSQHIELLGPPAGGLARTFRHQPVALQRRQVLADRVSADRQLVRQPVDGLAQLVVQQRPHEDLLGSLGSFLRHRLFHVAAYGN